MKRMQYKLVVKRYTTQIKYPGVIKKVEVPMSLNLLNQIENRETLNSPGLQPIP